jgi:effector-binding domain-containing protein
MKIKVWLIPIVILLIIAALAFFPVTVIHTETIASNFDNTYRHLNNLNEWQKWNPQLKKICSSNCQKEIVQNGKLLRVIFSNANDSIAITKPIPLSYNIDGFDNNNFVSYNLIILPSSSNNSLQVQSIEKVKLFHYLFFSSSSSYGQSALTALKNFLEDTKNVYGFLIETEKVTDTVFAVVNCATDSARLFTVLNKNFKLLDNYVQQHQLEKKGFYSVSYSAEQDSLHLILGIPVNKFAAASVDIHCVNIPKGTMLTGLYKGKFLNKRVIYRAFMRYATDHFKENVGAPFESYINNQLPPSDTSTVQFKFYYPVR